MFDFLSLTGYSLMMVKLALGILALIMEINLMGKGNLAPTSAMDQVQNYVLGGIIGGVIYSDAIGVLQFLLVLVGWTILIMSLKFLTTVSSTAKAIIDGKPVVLIRRGKVDVPECLRRGVRAGELLLKLRAAGVTKVADVKLAIMEQNGQLTVVQNGETNIHYPLISDGQVNKDMLDAMDKDEDWLRAELARENLQPSDVFLAEWNGNGLDVTPYEE